MIVVNVHALKLHTRMVIVSMFIHSKVLLLEKLLQCFQYCKSYDQERDFDMQWDALHAWFKTGLRVSPKANIVRFVVQFNWLFHMYIHIYMCASILNLKFTTHRANHSLQTFKWFNAVCSWLYITHRILTQGEDASSWPSCLIRTKCIFVLWSFVSLLIY